MKNNKLGLFCFIICYIILIASCSFFITDPPSTDATLSSIHILEGEISPEFTSRIYNYRVNVPLGTSIIHVTASSNDSNASISSGTGAIPITQDHSLVSIIVQAEDRISSKEYMITVIRESSPIEYTLESLEVSSGTLEPSFDSDTTYYELSLDHSIEALTVNAQTTDSNATVEVLSEYPLQVGGNWIELPVTSANEDSSKNYTIYATRSPALRSLGISTGSLNQNFDPSIFEYNTSVEYSVSQITLSAEPATSSSIIQGLGTLNLQEGENALDIRVVSGDSASEVTYRINILRSAPSDDPSLINLDVSSGTLVPEFSSDILNYSVSIPHSVSSIDLDITTANIYATTDIQPQYPIKVGTNVLALTVVAQNGEDSQTYTISVKRDPALTLLSLSEGVLSSPFQYDQYEYTSTVNYSVSEIVIAAEADDSSSIVAGTGVKTLATGSNIFEITATSEDGTCQASYRLTVTRKTASSDAALSNLELSSGTLSPAFNPDELSYTATVDNTCASMTLNAEASHYGAIITKDTLYELSVGRNELEVSVTAENGMDIRTYHITVFREPGLASLTIDTGDLTPAFNVLRDNYFSTVDNNITLTTISALAQNATSDVTGTGTKALALGENIFTITVTSEDGETEHLYHINITRVAPSSDARLASLILSNGTLNPHFSSDIYSYTCYVANEITSIEIAGELNGSGATLTGEGTYNLDEGINTVELLVTAEDGTTTLTYSINITREFLGSGLNIDFTGLEDETITLLSPSGPITQDTNLYVTVTESFDSYCWYIDGQPTGLTTRGIAYPCNGLEYGMHSITVIVENDGVFFSKELLFSVTQ